MTKQELLRRIETDDILNIDLQSEIESMKKRKKILESHPYSVFQSKDGKWRTYLPKEGGGRVQRERGTREEIEDVIVAYWRSMDNNPTVEEVFDEWNTRRFELQQISASTRDRNVDMFKRFYISSGFSNRHIKNIKENDWLEFLEEQVPKYKLRSKAFNNLKTLTKGFLIRAKRLGYISWDPNSMIRDLAVCRADYNHKIKDYRGEVFNEEETATMLQYLIGHIDNQYNACLLLMFITGIRVGEAITLKHEDIFEDSIDIRRTETRVKDENGKTTYAVSDFPKTEAGVRTVVIPSQYRWLLQRLQCFNPDSEWVFVGQLSHERTTYNSMRRHLEYVCKATGVYPKSLHKIRRTYSSILLDNGVDNRLVTDQMGHTDISMDEVFYHRTRRNIQRKQAILDNIPDFQIAELVTKSK